MEDSYDATMSVNTENYRTNPATVTVHATEFTDGEKPTYKYELISPLESDAQRFFMSLGKLKMCASKKVL
ncbi:MAG: hypothetical protein WDN26_11445 [Chitinophagaceae bacterium]